MTVVRQIQVISQRINTFADLERTNIRSIKFLANREVSDIACGEPHTISRLIIGCLTSVSVCEAFVISCSL